MARTRRVLMVALRYPPVKGTGIIRTLKFQKYLPIHGWVGDTLTGALDGLQPPFLQEPAHEGPGRTLRIRFADPIRAAERKGDARSAVYLRRIGFSLLPPDGRTLFVPAAFARWPSVWRRYDALHSSGMPWSGLLAAASLKLRLGCPLVQELRDPWIEGDGIRVGRFRNRIERFLERAALGAADAVVVTATGLKDDLIRRRPPLADRIWVIPNGYDEEDFSGPVASPLGPFDIVHTGNFYGTKGPTELFEGVNAWLTAVPERRPLVRIRLVGPIRGSDIEAAQRTGVDDIVSFDGSVSHLEAVARLRAGRVAVAIDYGAEQARTRVLSKVFEYMRSGLPILFLSSGGGTEEVLRRCDRAFIVRREDRSAVANALETIAGGPRVTEYSADAHTQRFERRVLAGEFARLLATVSDDPSVRAR